MPDLKSLLNDPNVTLDAVTQHLDGLPHAERVSESTSINGKEQKRLWELAESGKAIDLDYLVPPDAPELEPFPFEGKNSLPVFTRFQKVFYKTQEGTIGGYNNSPVGPIVGPGYYVTRIVDEHPKELGVDYLQVPKSKPASWPPIRPNESGLQRFVYANMIDYLRFVSEDVVIGRAYKAGTKPMPNYFVLCRATARS